MFRRNQVEQFKERKLALVHESGAHRLVLQAELQNLRSASGRATKALRSPRKLAIPTALVAAIAGFLLTRRRTRAALKTAIWAGKWGVPLYRLWKSFSASPQPRQPKGLEGRH